MLAFNIGAPGELQRLAREIESQLPPEEASSDDPHTGRSAKQYRRGLREVERLAKAALASSDASEEQGIVKQILETVAAMNDSQRAVIPSNVDLLQVPWLFLGKLHRPVGKGSTMAEDLKASDETDLSKIDPKPSMFWHRPEVVAAQDVFHGFGRTEFPIITNQVWRYSGPKLSTGLNPGFEVTAEGVTLKLKFAEVSSEPFAARIFAALGYNADPTDYVPWVKVRYERRLLTEFNRRTPLTTRFTVFACIPLQTLRLQKRYDPLKYIAFAVLRDGTRWSGRELRARLFYHPARRHPELEPANFRPEIETDIDYLVTAPANVQSRGTGGKSVGLWDFGRLDHADRRELRGLGLLGAWVGWFDTRPCNTRLRIVKRGDGRELVAFCSDLGGVLGESGGLLYSRGELPNAFAWDFTRPPLRQGPHQMALPLRLHGYRPVDSNPAFAAMTIDDARWMARLIAQLTEGQLIEALVASGYDSSEVRLYMEKLVSRRDRMVQDLGLAKEIALYRPAGADRRLAYNPAINGPVEVQVTEDDPIQAPVGTSRIEAGQLVCPFKARKR